MTATARRQAPLLSIYELSVEFDGARGKTRVLDTISLDLPRGQILAVVGESGCGKSTLAHTLLRLLSPDAANITHGAILFEHEDLVRMQESRLQRVRGARIGLAFQDPLSALERDRTVGQQIASTIRLHETVSRKEADARALLLLKQLGVPAPEQRMREYPNTLSEGLRARVMLAVALACNPSLLIADEPTSSLDLIAQAQVLSALRGLRDESGLSILLIANNLEVVADIADAVVVLYAGQVVEQGPTAQVLRSPAHPYTTALLRSIPPRRSAQRGLGEPLRKLPMMRGAAPSFNALPSGCRFEPRCADREASCAQAVPPLREEGPRQVRCLLTDDLAYAREQAAKADARGTEGSSP